MDFSVDKALRAFTMEPMAKEKPKPTRMRQVQIRMPGDLFDRLKSQAAADRREFSDYVRLLLTDALKK